jgi:hypothetical protein
MEQDEGQIGQKHRSADKRVSNSKNGSKRVPNSIGAK